jgi:hypothetical protein
MRFYDIGRGAYFAKCLLNPVLRGSYARRWLWSARRSPLRKTLREVRGAAHFWVRMLLS